MPTFDQQVGEIPPAFDRLLGAGPLDQVLTELRHLRHAVERLQDSITPPVSPVLTGDAVMREFKRLPPYRSKSTEKHRV